MKESPTKYNLKPLIIALLNEQGKNRFAGFAAEAETHLEPVIEAVTRKKLSGILRRIARQALASPKQNNSPKTDSTQETL